MKSIIVQKFGGVCLESPEKIKHVAKAAAELSREGHGVVLVVSAMGKTTDQLVKLAYEVSSTPNRRELDMLLTTGERISMALMGMALTDLGCRAISFTGSQAGVMTDGSHSNARIIDIRPIRIQEELARASVIVLAGFQGVNPDTKEITTLGRGGTDTTAVAMAAKLGAARCDIVKEVDGVCSADPRLVPQAKPIPKMTYASLREMCFWGAKVLHYRSVELAEQTQVPLFIRRWGSNDRVTQVVKEDLSMELCQILSVNSHSRIEHFEVQAPTLNQAFLLFEKHLVQKSLPRPQVLESTFDQGLTRLVLTGDGELLDSLIKSIEGVPQIRNLEKTLSSVTVTCHGSLGTDLAARVMNCLETDGVRVDKILFTPLSVSVCVEPARREDTIRSLHKLIERK